MIIYYIVFRTILHQHLFLHHILPLLFLPVFPTTTVGEEKAGVLWGSGDHFGDIGRFFCWDIGDIGSGRGPLGPAVEISVQHQIHIINFVFFFFFLFFLSSYGIPREVRNSVSTFAAFVVKCDAKKNSV